MICSLQVASVETCVTVMLAYRVYATNNIGQLGNPENLENRD